MPQKKGGTQAIATRMFKQETMVKTVTWETLEKKLDQTPLLIPDVFFREKGGNTGIVMHIARDYIERRNLKALHQLFIASHLPSDESRGERIALSAAEVAWSVVFNLIHADMYGKKNRRAPEGYAATVPLSMLDLCLRYGASLHCTYDAMPDVSLIVQHHNPSLRWGHLKRYTLLEMALLCKSPTAVELLVALDAPHDTLCPEAALLWQQYHQ